MPCKTIGEFGAFCEHSCRPGSMFERSEFTDGPAYGRRSKKPQIRRVLQGIRCRSGCPGIHVCVKYYTFQASQNLAVVNVVHKEYLSGPFFTLLVIA